MLSRIRTTPTFKPTLPFWVKTFYDLSQPGDKADIAKILHRVIFRCNESMKASHRTVLAFIFDRTIGWDKHYERITYDQFQDGVLDRNGIQVAHGTRLSRKTISKCLDDLIEWGVVLRRIETGCKIPPKYFYALNLGAGVGVKNRDGSAYICAGVNYLDSVPNLFKSERQHKPEDIFTVVETVFVDGKMTQRVTNSEGEPMLAIPKRLKQSVRELTPDEKIRQEFGEVIDTTVPAHSTTSTPVEKGNCPQFTFTPENPSDRCNRETKRTQNLNSTEEKDTQAGGAIAPVMQELNQTLERMREARTQTHSRKRESAISKATLSITELEGIWKTTYSQVHGKNPLPWGMKQKGQIKTMQSKWIASGRKEFGRALVWWVQRWEEVGALFFNLRDSGQENTSYPSEPVLGFLTACFETYTRAYDKSESVDEVPAMSKKQLFEARLRLRGYEEGKIAALSEQKFSKDKDKKVIRPQGDWKQMIADMGKDARDKLQPVAKPDPVTPPPPSPPDNVLKFEPLEVWK